MIPISAFDRIPPETSDLFTKTNGDYTKSSFFRIDVGQETLEDLGKSLVPLIPIMGSGDGVKFVREMALRE